MGTTHEVHVRIHVKGGHAFSQEEVTEFAEMCIQLMLRHRIRMMKFWVDAKDSANIQTMPAMQLYEHQPFSETMQKIYSHISVPGIKIDLGDHAMVLAESNAVEVTLDKQCEKW